MLEKQANVQPSQNNRKNMVNKLMKVRIVPKLAPQQQMKPTHHKKEENANIDKKIKYARSVFLNAGGHTSKISLATKVMTSTIQE
jgi:hypothetical protein